MCHQVIVKSTPQIHSHFAHKMCVFQRKKKDNTQMQTTSPNMLLFYKFQSKDLNFQLNPQLNNKLKKESAKKKTNGNAAKSK